MTILDTLVYAGIGTLFGIIIMYFYLKITNKIKDKLKNKRREGGRASG